MSGSHSVQVRQNKIKIKAQECTFGRWGFIMDYLYDSSSTLLFNSAAYCVTLQTFKCKACGSRSDVLIFVLAVCFCLLVWRLVQMTDRRCVGENLHVRFVNLARNQWDTARSFVHRKRQQKCPQREKCVTPAAATGYRCVLGHETTTDHAWLKHAETQRGLYWSGTTA